MPARLTCGHFISVEDAAAPCALRYDYHPNGNLIFKSDVGTLDCDDPLHPHAVTGAGTDSFGYDAVGNQITRPGGTAVRYTPFDLPKSITQGTRTTTFADDGDQQRIRKTTPEKETLSFGDLYERVTEAASGTVTHRYYVHSPERVVAIVTRGGPDEGTRYVHVDHLGSVDVLTNEDGSVVERRSHDPFGQRRNPVWGEPAPASFTSKTTRGFTGHEGDDELGLVNRRPARGRRGRRLRGPRGREHHRNRVRLRAAAGDGRAGTPERRCRGRPGLARRGGGDRRACGGDRPVARAERADVRALQRLRAPQRDVGAVRGRRAPRRAERRQPALPHRPGRQESDGVLTSATTAV